MRACARVALASIAVSASFSLSGCAAIEELKETFLRWVEGNLRRLSLRRGACLVAGPKHRHPDVFHTKSGHRITGLPRER